MCVGPEQIFFYSIGINCTLMFNFFTKTISSFRCVLTPGDPYMPLPNAEIINRVAKQVNDVIEWPSFLKYLHWHLEK